MESVNTELLESQMQALYESVGVEFLGNKAILSTPRLAKIVVPKATLLCPTEADVRKLAAMVKNSIRNTVDFELFDVDDPSHEFSSLNFRRREIGRYFSHFQEVCENCECSIYRIYDYVYLEASNVSDDGWEKMVQYVVCVAGVIGILVMLTLIPGGGVIIANFATLAAVVVTGCVLVVGGSDANNAKLVVEQGR